MSYDGGVLFKHENGFFFLSWNVVFSYNGRISISHNNFCRLQPSLVFSSLFLATLKSFYNPMSFLMVSDFFSKKKKTLTYQSIASTILSLWRFSPHLKLSLNMPFRHIVGHFLLNCAIHFLVHTILWAVPLVYLNKECFGHLLKPQNI